MRMKREDIIKLTTRNDMINYLMRSGLFRLGTLQQMNPTELEDLFFTALDVKGIKTN